MVANIGGCLCWFTLVRVLRYGELLPNNKIFMTPRNLRVLYGGDEGTSAVLGRVRKATNMYIDMSFFRVAFSGV